MRFDQWRAQAAQIAVNMYDSNLEQVSRPYLWDLYRDGVSPLEAAELSSNVLAGAAAEALEATLRGSLAARREAGGR